MVSTEKICEIKKCKEEGLSVLATALKLEVSKGTVYKYYSEHIIIPEKTEEEAEEETKKQKKHKKTKCLKCHKEFLTELDKMGIPYKKICPECTRQNQGKIIKNNKLYL